MHQFVYVMHPNFAFSFQIIIIIITKQEKGIASPVNAKTTNAKRCVVKGTTVKKERGNR